MTMLRTAADEHYGRSIAAIITADYSLALPFGPGGCRFYSLTPNAGTYDVRLPNATYCRSGAQPVATVEAVGANGFTLTDYDGGTVQAVAAGECWEARLLSNSTAAGTWIVRRASTAVQSGTPLTIGRVPLVATIGSGFDFDLREYWDALGYDGVTAAALRCTLMADAVLGASSTSSWGFDSGTWPAGSTLLLIVSTGATISGMGGAGGVGGNAPLSVSNTATAGSAGGPALRLSVTTALGNYGTIQGGGGGGGGARATYTQGGGGGGGGAGLGLSQGGAGGSVGGGAPGFSGHLFVAGGGGSTGNVGGTGGGPGTAGDQGGPTGTGTSTYFVGAAGGAAGDAIQRLSTVTLTTIRTGTILGAQTTF